MSAPMHHPNLPPEIADLPLPDMTHLPKAERERLLRDLAVYRFLNRESFHSS